MERLQKLIAQAGIASRRKAEELIAQGRVRVNGKVISVQGYQASPEDEITVDGKPIQKEEHEYYLLNKPKHTICSAKDEKGRETVLSCMTGVSARIFPVGRLDYETTGVLLLTNDGQFANLMMHPSHHIPRTYEAAIEGILDSRQMNMLRKGIELEDGKTMPAEVRMVSVNEAKKKSVLSITIQEGRNREIRRMMEYFGCTVTRLDRKQFGFLDAGRLRQGEYRRLKPIEIRRLSQEASVGVNAKTR